MENNKQPEKKVRLLDTAGGVWGLIILLYGIIFLLIYIANVTSVKDCDVPGCTNTCDKDERYCKDHKHHDLYITWNVSTATKGRKNVDTTTRKSKSVNTTTKSQSGASKKNNRTNYYTGDIYSAEKYNNPDDFADDWEDDFDSWEDAYDYWEDVME